MRSLGAGVLVLLDPNSDRLRPNLSAMGRLTVGRDGTGGMTSCKETSDESCLRRGFKRKLNSLRFDDTSERLPPSDSSPAVDDFFAFFSFLLTEDV